MLASLQANGSALATFSSDTAAPLFPSTRWQHATPAARSATGSTKRSTCSNCSFARALGEYGSVIFIAGNLPMVSEITPLIIITKLEQYDYAGATAIATVMLVVSFLLLLIINLLQAWSIRRSGGLA